MISPQTSLADIRSEFSSLDGEWAFFENAGGSQIPDVVVDAVADYYRTSYVQLGAGYALSDQAAEPVAAARKFMATYLGAASADEVVFGASTSQLLYMLSECFRREMVPGDEVVVSVANHEANINPWRRLEREGIIVKYWGIDPESFEQSIEELEGLMDFRTRVVAVQQTSNLLGEVSDIGRVAEVVRRFGSRLVVDGVAFASHGGVDVQAIDADFYVLSNYKVYGPHMATMHGKAEAWEHLRGPNHFFVPNEAPRKFELGCLSYESLAGIAALEAYFSRIGGFSGSRLSREQVLEVGSLMGALERPVKERIVAAVRANENLRLIGPSDLDKRVATISFVHESLPSEDVAMRFHDSKIAMRHGHMYSYRLCQALGIDVEQGVARISAVHYNSPEEAERVAEVVSSL